MKHTIEIPDKLLDKASQKLIKALEKELAAAQTKLERQDNKVHTLKKDIERLKGGEFNKDEKLVFRLIELMKGVKSTLRELGFGDKIDCWCPNCGNEHEGGS